MLKWLGCGAIDYKPFQGGSTRQPSPEEASEEGGGTRLVAARRGLQDWIGHCLAAAATAGAGAASDGEDGCNGTSAAAIDSASAAQGLPALVAAAALLEEVLPGVAPALSPGGAAAGVRAASRIYSQVAEAVPASYRAGSAMFEGLGVRHCRLLTSGCLARVPAVTPRVARDAVLQALQLWPHNGELPALLPPLRGSLRCAARPSAATAAPTCRSCSRG